jgi:hypothetical protein
MTKMMRFLIPGVLSIALALPAAAVAQRDDSDGHPRDHRRGDQYDAYQARKSGHVKPLREIEGRIVPRMAGSSYLGPEFDQATGIYTLKFMRRGDVIWLHVDGRTGAVIGRSGH